MSAPAMDVDASPKPALPCGVGWLIGHTERTVALCWAGLARVPVHGSDNHPAILGGHALKVSEVS